MIDQCNAVDEELAEFFAAVVRGDMEVVKRKVLIDPLVAMEVNDQMETALHIAVSMSHFDIVEYLLEQDCGKVLTKATDLKRRKPLDIAKSTK